MSLATCYLDYGRHLARLRRRRRRRRRRRAYAPTSNTASQGNHEKINSWVSFAFLYVFEYGAPLGGPSGRRSSATIHDCLCENRVPIRVYHFAWPEVKRYVLSKSIMFLAN